MSVSSPTPNTINSHSLYQHSCTAVRIPTSRAHSESIVALFEKPVDVAAARKALEEAPGVLLKDDPENMVSHGYFIALMILVNKNAKKIITPHFANLHQVYPMPLTATGQYDIEVGRLRKNIAFDNALEFFVCGDQLLRGAALNAVAVAEAMVDNGALKSKVSA